LVSGPLGPCFKRVEESLLALWRAPPYVGC
jgi:hypothetical protein